MSSPDLVAGESREAETALSSQEQLPGHAAAHPEVEEGLDPEIEDPIINEGPYADSAYGTEGFDDGSSVDSMDQSYIENGRRYQALRWGAYWGPCDAQQWESQQAAHIVHLLLDCSRENSLFRSPISKTPRNILDLGTGNGCWAIDVADINPSAQVQGIDLHPPSDYFCPPNCHIEVRDVLEPWPHQEKFDLIHLRWLYGSFTSSEWDNVYDQTYQHLLPGGWIEQVEPSIMFRCDDDTLPADSVLRGWGPMFLECCAATGKDINTIDTFQDKIEAHGFTNVHHQLYKVPLGEWAKAPYWKEVGRYNMLQAKAGLEGYVLYLLTKFGRPTPWSLEEVQAYLAKVRKDLDSGYRIYIVVKRVWAQKPLDAEMKAE